MLQSSGSRNYGANCDFTADPFITMTEEQQPRTPSPKSQHVGCCYSSPSSPSYFYTFLLPTSVQTRISRFRTRNGRSSPSESPTPRPHKGITDPMPLQRADGTLTKYQQDESSTSAESLPPSSYSRRASPRRGQPSALTATATVIATASKECRYARHGINMLETILLESELPTDDPRKKTFIRQHYIQTLNVFLHGLPEDLSEAELESLRMALPAASLSSPPPSLPALDCHQQQQQQQYLARTDQRPQFQRQQQQQQQSHHHQSFPHRISAFIILLLFLVLQALIPYLKILARTAYRFEREHRVTEHAFAWGVSVTEASWRLVARIVSWAVTQERRGGGGGGEQEQGRVGHLLIGCLLWWGREVSEGFGEGVGKGMEVLGLEGASI